MKKIFLFFILISLFPLSYAQFGGDSLGSHKANKNLDMREHDIDNPNLVDGVDIPQQVALIGDATEQLQIQDALIGDATEQLRTDVDAKLPLIGGTLSGSLQIQTSVAETLKVMNSHYNGNVISFESYVSGYEGGVILSFTASDASTIGVNETTQDGKRFAWIHFNGVNSSSNVANGATIIVEQDGDAGTKVPAKITFETYSASGKNTDQLVLNPDGSVDVEFILKVDTITSNNSDHIEIMKPTTFYGNQYGRGHDSKGWDNVEANTFTGLNSGSILAGIGFNREGNVIDGTNLTLGAKTSNYYMNWSTGDYWRSDGSFLASTLIMCKNADGAANMTVQTEAASVAATLNIRCNNGSPGVSKLWFGDADADVARIEYSHSLNTMYFMADTSFRFLIDGNNNQYLLKPDGLDVDVSTWTAKLFSIHPTIDGYFGAKVSTLCVVGASQYGGNLDATGHTIYVSSVYFTGSDRGYITSESDCVDFIVLNGSLFLNVTKASGTVKIENVLQFAGLFQAPKDNYPMGSIIFDTDTYKLYVTTSDVNTQAGVGWNRIDYGSVAQSHIEIYIDTAASTPITQDVFTGIAGDYADGLALNFSWEGSSITYTGTVGARFDYEVNMCITAGTAVEGQWQIYVNDVALERPAKCVNLPNNDKRDVGIGIILDLNPNDVVQLRVTTPDGEDLTHNSLTIKLVEIKQ